MVVRKPLCFLIQWLLRLPQVGVRGYSLYRRMEAPLLRNTQLKSSTYQVYQVTLLSSTLFCFFSELFAKKKILLVQKKPSGNLSIYWLSFWQELPVSLQTTVNEYRSMETGVTGSSMSEANTMNFPPNLTALWWDPNLLNNNSQEMYKWRSRSLGFLLGSIFFFSLFLVLFA